MDSPKLSSNENISDKPFPIVGDIPYTQISHGILYWQIIRWSNEMLEGFQVCVGGEWGGKSHHYLTKQHKDCLLGSYLYSSCHLESVHNLHYINT